jgi:hypothetical protein
MQKQGQKQAEQRRKVCFLENALEGEEEKATLESNQAEPTTSHHYWAEGGAAG